MSLRLPNGRDLNPRRWPCADGSQFEASPSVIEVLMDDGSWRAAVALKPGDGEHDGWVLAQDGSGTNTLVWWCAPGEWRAVSMPDQPVGHTEATVSIPAGHPMFRQTDVETQCVRAVVEFEDEA